MKYEHLVSKKFLSHSTTSLSQPLVTIATWSIALAVLVMLMAVSILRGFQHNIEQKVIGFGSHISVRSQEVGHFYLDTPIHNSRSDRTLIEQHPAVSHIAGVATIGGMIKTDKQIQGIMMKGIAADYDTAFLHQCLVAGRLPHLNSDTTLPASNEIMLSQSLADKLGLLPGDKVRTYFWSGDNYRARAFTLAGLFATDIPELDDHFMVGDLKQIQRLNNWTADQVASWEITLHDFDDIGTIATEIYQAIDYDLNLSTIVEDNASLFAWLNLLNSNIVLILTIMAVVCVVAVVSALLIMIFEKTQMIGILKTLGASDGSIRRIFAHKTLHIALRAILFGSAIAFVLSFVQARWQLLKLDSESYSIAYVPVEINPMVYIAIAIGTLAVCLLAMWLPSAYISRIEPAKSIRFE